MLTFLKNLPLFLLLTLISSQAYGADEVYVDFRQGSAIHSASFTVTDPRYGTSGSFYTASVENQLTFGIEHTLVTTANTGILNATVNLRITEEGGTPYTKSLNIHYDFNAGYIHAKDKETYSFSGAQEVLVEVLSVNINGANVSSGQVPSILYLQNRIEVNRFYDLNLAVAPAYTKVGARGIDLINDGSVNYQELEMYWEVIAGAEEYELQWTYLDNYSYNTSSQAYSFKTAAQQDFDLSYFDDNSTSITISHNFYRIPLVYDRGFIMYRVRAVGRGGPGNDYSHIVKGQWSTNSVSPTGTAGKVNKYHYFEINGTSVPAHFPHINWQLNTLFAEEGKKKESLSYADGSHRVRQSLTRNNTDDRTIVGETVYDHQGRPAVQILPAPVVDAVGVANNARSFLGYKPAFNKSADQPSKSFSRLDFDLDETVCDITPSGLNNGSGAGLYYSTNNGEKDNINAYIPDAAGFPYIRTQYTPDNTGRISRVSGVGPYKQISSNGKFVSNFYSQPFQADLDRLFSCNIGYSSFYRKTISIDPNGQVSVTYKDNTGKTVATALAGAPPSALEPLKDETGTSLYTQSSAITVDLLNKAQVNDVDTDQDANILVNSGSDNMLRFSSGVPVVSENTILDFDYSLETTPFSDTCQDFTYQPVYDLNFSLTDECGESIISGITNPTQVGSYSVSSGTYTLPTIDFTSAGLKVGSYSVNKELKVNLEVLDDYADHFIDNASCILDFDDFFTPSDTSGCNISCEECAAAVSPSDPDYAALVEACWEPCNYASPCDIAFMNMLADVSPYGQYAKLEQNTDGTVHDPLSLFSANSILYSGSAWQNPVFYTTLASQYYEEDLATPSTIQVTNGEPANTAGISNGYISPAQLSNFEDFVDNWRASWAYSLVTYHPEWASYALCADLKMDVFIQYNNISSEDYDHMLSSTKTHIGAQAIPLFRSTSNGTLNLATTNYAILDNDPFFKSGSPGNFLEGAIRAELQDYLGTGMDIYQFADFTHSCGNWFGNDYSNCTGADLDLRWQTVRSIYLSLKKKYIGRYFDNGGSSSSTAISPCYSGCIGEQNFNPFNKSSFVSSAGSPTYISPTAPYFNASQPCSAGKFGLFNNKARRFYSEYPYYTNTYDQEGNGNQAGSTLYQQTGMCPLALDLKNLLQELAEEDLLTRLSSTFSRKLHRFDYYSKNLYEALLIKKGASIPNGIDDFIATHNLKQFVLSIPVTSSSQLQLSFNLLTSTATTTIIGPGTNFFNNYKVVNIRRVFFTYKSGSTYYFKIEAEIESRTGAPNRHVEILQGETFLAIGNCSYDPVASASNDMQLFKQLLNVLLLQNTGTSNTYFISTTGVNLEGTSSPQDKLQGVFSQYPRPLLTTKGSEDWEWQKTGTNIFEIYDATANSSSLKMQMEFCSPPVNGYSSITFISEIKPNIDNCGCSSITPNFQAKVRTVGPAPQYVKSIETLCGRLRILNGANEVIAVNIGTTSLPGEGEGPCHTPEHLNFSFLESVFDSHPNDINSGNDVPVYLDPSHSLYSMPYAVFASAYYPVFAAMGYNYGSLNGLTDASRVFLEEKKNNIGSRVGQLCFMERVAIAIPTDPGEDLEPDPGGGSQTRTGRNSTDSSLEEPGFRQRSSGRGPNVSLQLEKLFASYAEVIPNDPDYVWNTGCCINYEMLDTTLPGVYIEDITSFSNLRIDYSRVGADGKYHHFFVDGTYSSGTVQFSGYSPCLAIKSCVECSEVSDPLTAEITSVEDFWDEYQSLVSTYSFLGLTSYTLADFSYYGLYEVFSSYAVYISYISAKYTGATGTEGYIIDIKDYKVNKLDFYLDNYKTLLNKIYSNNSSSLPVSTAQDYITLMDFGGAHLGNCFTNYPTLVGTGPDPVLFADSCEPVFPCPQPLYVPFPEPDYFDDEEDPCATAIALIDSANALQAYQSYLDDMRQEFKKKYIDHALSTVIENFDMQTTIGEYHHTLYYYDQAGNLIRTVPPKGVAVLGSSAINNSKTNRNLDNDVDLTSHTMATTYKYNSLNQVIRQQTPDGGVTNFWYDPIGRLILSQNAKQASGNDYAYTLFDNIGRIIETGKVHNVNSLPTNISTDAAAYATWLGVPANNPRTEVSRIFYDEPVNSTVEGYFTNGQNHLRNRVATVTYSAVYNNDISQYQYATHYTYDFQGNVNELIQEDRNFEIAPLIHKLEYTYDLVSGNVHQVAYQSGEYDQFFQRYEYDAENRIKQVITSRDGIFWERDAKYFYYLHGPLARTEMGDCQVQGLDYAYTLDGWTKGVNSSILKSETDPGDDGLSASTNPHTTFSRDMFGYSLRYNDQDYAPIASISASDLLYPKTTGTQVQSQIPGLYNGNISFMTTAISDNEENSAPIQGRGYKYDQLNRLINSRTYQNMQSGKDMVANNNTFAGISAQGSSSPYYTAYEYDPNGNITNLVRKKQDGTAMDDLDYYYQDDDNGFLTGQNSNKLLSVWENVSSSGLTTDIQSHAGTFVSGSATGNVYEYDEIGNLIKDKLECIANIEWTLGGKVSRVEYYSGNCSAPGGGNGPVSSNSDLEFRYDASGNRTVKIVKPRDGSGNLKSQKFWVYTHYVRDAQGHIMALYERTFDTGSEADYRTTVELKESNIFGSDRLGVVNRDITSPVLIEFDATISNGLFTNVIKAVEDISTTSGGPVYSRLLNRKRYEMTNHLGNVLNTLSDRKVIKSTTEYTYSHTTLIEDELYETLVTRFPDMEWEFEGEGYMDNWGEEGIFVEAEGESVLQTHFEKPADNPCDYWLCIEFSPDEWSGDVLFLQVTDEGGHVLFSFEITEPGRHCFRLDFEPSMGESFFVKLLTENSFRYLITDFIIYTDCGWERSPDEFGGEITVTPTEGEGLQVVASSETYIQKEVDFEAGESCTYQLCVQMEITGGSAPYFQLVDAGGDVLQEWPLDEECIDITPDGFSMADVRYLRFFHYDEAEYNFYGLTIEENCTTSVTETDLLADVISGHDYYPFGSTMPGRTFNSGDYRYGFIGAENDNEISGVGNAQDHMFRSYDPRLGRYKSLDPLARDYPWNSPFAYAENRVMDGFDLEGLEYISVHNFQRLRQENPGMAHAMGVAMAMGGNLQTIHYKGADYYKINTHLNANDGTRLTQWIYTPIAPVIPQSDFIKWSTKSDCYANCQEQLGKQNNSSDAYWPSAFQMYKEGSSGKGVTEASKLAGLDALHKAVEGGNGIMVGVDYGATTSDDKNLDKTTDHFITIVGRGNDANGEFFTFYENAVNDQSEGTDVSTNKLYIQSDGTLKGNTSWSSNIKFTVTQVRPNKEEE